MPNLESPFLPRPREQSFALPDGEAYRIPETPFTDYGAYESDTASEEGEDGKAEPSDAIDAFLESRRSLFKVVLVGTRIQSSVARSYEWTKRYTNRALTEAALGAALNQMYMGGVTAAKTKKVYEQVVGSGVKYTPATKQASTSDARHLLIIDPASLKKISTALNLSPREMVESWRLQIGEAKLIQLALREVLGTFDSLSRFFQAKDLAAAGLSPGLIRMLLDKHMDTMINVARRQAAGEPWRKAFRRNLALFWAEREPIFADLDKAPPSQWAKTVLDLAAATRKLRREQLARSLAESRRQARNDHLRPHEIEVADAAKFILENYEPTHTVRLHTTNWDVRGGMQLTNIKNEPIFLLGVDSGQVIFQNLSNKRFYRQSLEGFGEEQLYSIYAMAGAKASGVIPLVKWVLSLAGAVFPIVRYGLLATDVINAGHKLQANRAELERHYDAIKVAYANIDALLPGVLPKIWDAVLDKRNVALFNPLKNPDVGAWLKAIIRIVLERQTRVVSGSYAADAVTGFLQKTWAAITKGLSALWEVIKHVIILAGPIAGSTGVSGQRALDLAQQRLKELGVIEAALIVNQVRKLARGDLDRLTREIQDLIDSSKQLLEVIHRSLEW